MQTPPTPSQAPPTEPETTPLENIPENDNILLTSANTQNDIDNEITLPRIDINEADNSKFHNVDEDDITTGVQRRKIKPAPPRPMPPKRRVRTTKLGCFIDCTSSLGSESTLKNSIL